MTNHSALHLSKAASKPVKATGQLFAVAPELEEKGVLNSPGLQSKDQPARRSGLTSTQLITLVAAALILLLLGAGYFLMIGLVKSPDYQPEYRNYATVSEVLNSDLLPGTRIAFPATLVKDQFLKQEESNRTYPLYHWIQADQTLEARFSYKLKELPEGNLIISGTVQSRRNGILLLYVEKTSPAN